MAGGIRQPGGRGRFTPMAEINVTPMVDVMLVLLIIFMVAAPLLTVGIEVDKPDTDAQAMTDSGEPITVSVTSEGRIFVQDTEIALDNLAPHLTAVRQAGYDQRIYVQGDRAASYDAVAQVLGALNGAGFTRIGLVTE
ncbi:TonB system transport protein, ExbD/TolR family protein [Parvularcula bermudensis HTCC2503]|uniref:TonB system transport protein, ExbD/TolR family protein n=1 Tax=Parvularcula bermudensis (strain ATCC BAA-594 / HTCC2503 / KCTC 12087) TaxID=314260 RepID=E0TDJ0_PARBH|nr:protein TolR [Parvularcula bermudensis]ADM08745.1 TonB system transport protein, ExbD/TolR family protein [Parvularcula bermudensis HTCC2503]